MCARRFRWTQGCVVLWLSLGAACTAMPPEPVVVCEDGGWCWFQDERALVVGEEVWVGSVASGRADPARRGDVQVTAWNPASGARRTVELHDRLQLDDHDAPALLRCADGAVLAVYAKHGSDDQVRWRRSAPDDPLTWSAEQTLDAVDDGRLGATYANLFHARDGDGAPVVLDVFRGSGWDPDVLISRDQGRSFARAGQLLSGPGRPYLKYAGDGRVVHFVATEQHPRDFDNSLWHGVLDGSAILRSDGARAGALGAEPPRPEDLTRIFAGGPDAVAWPCDLELDAAGHPRALFTIQRDGAGLPARQGGMDHRLGLARWDGATWTAREIGFAGTRLYAGEDDYTGLACFDPDDLDVVYFATDAHPATGVPLISRADGRRHREIFRGATRDGGATWHWTALTRDSAADNLRPLVPRRAGGGSALLWLRGEYRSYTDYDLELVGLPLPPR